MLDLQTSEQSEKKQSRLNEYFANFESDMIIAELRKRELDYYRYLRTSGKLDRWEKSYLYYYGMDRRGMSALDVNRGGSQGELSTMRVNHYRSLNQSLLTLTTSQQMAFETRALNSDHRSQAQTLIASSLLDYYQKEKGLGQSLKDTCEYNLIFDEAFLYSPWDDTLGDEKAADLQRGVPIKAGDIAYSARTPLEVIRDIRNRGKKHNWHIIKSRANKYDLAAENPELADEIINYTSTNDKDEDSFLLTSNYGESQSSSDEVTFCEFWHGKTAAVPEGRYVRYVGNTVLDDYTLDELKYDETPLARMAANEQAFSIFGYSNTLDLLAIQEAVDQLYSTVLSNQSAFGVSNVWKQKGSPLTLTQLQGGLNLLESEEKPEAINLTSTPPEIFSFIQQLEGVMEKLSGVNSTVRGDPGSNLKSGAALALVASQSIQLMGNLSTAYETLFEEVGSRTFKILQAKASIPRVVAITGKYNSSYIENFTGQDIAHVSKIVVDKGNYLTKTAAGRVELANSLLQSGLIPTAQEYISVIQTGRLEPLLEAPMAELLNVRAENESLKDGKQVPVIRGDKHDIHKAEHLALLASPEARRNPEIVNLVLAHIDEHERIEIEEATRNAQFQMQIQAAGQPQQPPQGPQAPQGGPQGPGPGAAPAIQAPNPMGQAQSVRMPTNPLTGQVYEPGA